MRKIKRREKPHKTIKRRRTVQDAKEFIERNWEIGIKCPCCNQNVKLYKRKFNRSMAVCLIELHNRHTNKYLHIHELQNNKLFRLHMNGGNFATMRYWGVIKTQTKDGANATSRTSGKWKITRRGRKFVKNKIKIPKYIYTYNMGLEGVSEETTDIIESLTENFDYRELMRG